jgi:purine-binding chemotaxis protein CheW
VTAAPIGAVTGRRSGSARVQLCTFWLDEHLLALPIESVREVLPAQPVTRVPLAPEEVVGLVNLRGEVVTILDLRARLVLPASGCPTARGVHVMVGEHGGAAVGLLADRVDQVLEPGPDQFVPPPATLPAEVAGLVTAVCTLDEQLVLVLDTDSIHALGGTS